MKNFFFFLALALPFSTIAQEAPPYTMFMSFYMSPTVASNAEFQSVMKAHNDKYHAEGSYGVRVFSVMNGKHSGDVVWAMGPTTWTQQDHAPAGNENHNADWAKVVALTQHGIENIEYWRMDNELNAFPEGEFDLNILQVWIGNIHEGKTRQFNEALSQIVEQIKKSEITIPFAVYRNAMGNYSKRDVALVWYRKNLAQLDEPNTFAQQFEKDHGFMSWSNFMDDISDAWTITEVEMRKYMPNMGGLTATTNRN